VYHAVRSAIDLGYRHIDCAAIYQNEEEVGRALRDVFRAGEVTREEVWITSKLWNDSHAPKHVRPALETSLRKLKLDRLDLYLIHWPVALRHGVALPRGPEDFLPLSEVASARTLLGGHHVATPRNHLPQIRRELARQAGGFAHLPVVAGQRRR